MKQALIIIDMQNGFLNPQSPLCIKGARATVPACARVIAACRRAGVPVIFVNRAYRADGSDVELTRRQVWAGGGKPLTPGSTGPISVENPPEFGAEETDYIIVKPRYSAFFQTSLDLLLRRLGVDTVILTGTTTPNCIRTTCYDAISLDYQAVVLEDCCSSNTKEIQRANMADMGNVGAEVCSSASFLRTLDGGSLAIRTAVEDDLDRCTEIERACFPREQAASREAIRDRIAVYGNHFLAGELDGQIIGYAMGPVIRQEYIADEMFGDTGCHDEAAPWQSVFSLAVHPDWQGRGYGRELLNALIAQARREGRKGVTLTCLERKAAYYAGFGFENRGVSQSVHGGAVWYDMTLIC